MHSFKSVVIVKHPLDKVWLAIRDSIVEIAPLMSDIESVKVLERHEKGSEESRFVNEWRLSAKLPAIASTIIEPGDLGWLDYARWDNSNYVCRWSIEPFFHPESIRCSGITKYESAIGGRGTRVTFQGDVDIDVAQLAGLSKTISSPVSSIVENVVTTIVPRNFRKVYEAAEHWLNNNGND